MGFTEGQADDIAAQTAHLEAIMEVAATQDVVDTIGEISSAGIPAMMVRNSELFTTVHGYVEKRAEEEMWWGMQTNKRDTAFAVTFLVAVMGFGTFLGFMGEATESLVISMGIPVYLIALLTVPGFVANRLTARSTGVTVAEIRERSVPKPQRVQVSETQEPVMSTLSAIVQLSEHPKTVSQRTMLTALSEKYMKLVWLAATAQNDADALTETIEVGELIGDDMSTLREKQQGLLAVTETVAMYDRKVSERIASMSKLVNYTGTEVRITSENLGRAAALVMDEIDVMLEMIELGG